MRDFRPSIASSLHPPVSPSFSGALSGLRPDLGCAWLFAAVMESDILRVMKQATGIRFSCKELGRIVDRDVYRGNPNWARPILEKLLQEGTIWKDEGYYLFPSEEQRAQQRLTPGAFRPSDIPAHRLPPQK